MKKTLLLSLVSLFLVGCEREQVTGIHGINLTKTGVILYGAGGISPHLVDAVKLYCPHINLNHTNQTLNSKESAISRGGQEKYDIGVQNGVNRMREIKMPCKKDPQTS
jgi:hypothetical protein